MSSKIALSLIAIFVVSLFAGCQSNVERYRKEGIAYYQQDQYDQALESLNKALSYDQFDAKGNTYAGLIHYRAGHYNEAAYHFKTALQADPSSEQAKDGITSTLIQQGKPDLALDFLERLATQAERVRDPRWEKSLTNRPYQKQVEEGLYTGRAGDRLRIARTYEKLGDYDNAAVYYNKAIEIAPKSGKVLLAAAEMYEKIGNKLQTRELLVRAYTAAPATPGLTQAMTRNNIAISSIIGTPLQ